MARSTGSPQRYLGANSAPSMTGPTSTQVDHSPRAGTTTSNVISPGATRSAPTARISTPRATGPRR